MWTTSRSHAFKDKKKYDSVAMTYIVVLYSDNIFYYYEIILDDDPKKMPR